MQRQSPNMEGRTAKFLLERGVSDFGGPNRVDRNFGGHRGGSGKHYQDRDNPRGEGGGFNFAMNKNSRAIQRKSKTSNLNRIDESGDVIMDGEKTSHSSRVFPSPFGRVRGNKKWVNIARKGQYQDQTRTRHNFGPTWHKILIYDGAQHAREFILTALANASSKAFQPVAYTPIGGNVVFFVEDRHSAEALAECSGRITAPDASKIEFKVDSCSTPPTAPIDDICLEKMRVALVHRYNPSPPSLNLSSFYSTPDLIIDYYLPLLRPSVLEKIFEILQSTLTALVYLDVSNNKMTSLDHFRKLSKLCPNLRGLNLRKNRLRDIHQLEKMEGLELHELMLGENPLCEKLKDREQYVSAVRKYFPKVVELDGVHTPPAISFDLDEPTKIPIRKPSFFCNELAKKVVLTFIEQYMLIYDSDNRQPLVEAYHDSAVMSMHCSYSKQNISTDNPMNKLSMYISDSRNLLRLIGDKSRRVRLIHEGKTNIVSFLSKLPRTTHDLNSLVIDMPLAVEAFILFTLSGVFKERGDRPTSVRTFQRSFTLVPQNQGFCIINELLYVTNANHAQSKEAFKPAVAAPTPSTSPVPYDQQSTAAGSSLSMMQPSSTVPSVGDTEKRAQMIVLFSQQSGMNSDWSRRDSRPRIQNHRIENHCNSEIIRRSGTIKGEQMIIDNCKNCKIYLLDHIAALNIDDCEGCIIVSGPVSGSIYVRDSRNSTLCSASGQLRLRDCNSMHLFCSSESEAIIENCADINIGPYSLSYKGILDNFRSSSLCPDKLIANSVYDFTPPVSDELSNWKVIPGKNMASKFIPPPSCQNQTEFSLQDYR